MAAKLIEARLSDGNSFFVEVEEVLGGGPRAVSIDGDGSGIIDFAPALNGIKASAEQLFLMLRSVAVPPTSCEIAFGIKLSGSVGAILAKVGTEANFSVKMTWDMGKSHAGPGDTESGEDPEPP